MPWWEKVDGTLVMADLSGFTALSERLARLGDEGAERLTGVINSFFEKMLKTTSRFGGDTLTFGGDAILLLFDGPAHATRAVAASLAMLKEVDRSAAVDAGGGRVRIGMSVGAHSGPFLLAATGLAKERAHLFVVGRGAEATALAEAQAQQGQLAVTLATRRLLPEDSTVAAIGDHWRVDGLASSDVPRVTLARPPLADRQLRELAPFLPPYARTSGLARKERRAGSLVTTAREEPGQGGRHAPEHRRAVIVFVNILGLTEVLERAGADTAVEQLQTYSAMLTRLAALHKGFVVSSDIATQGCKLIIAFGAPVAHEYAPANAARFVLGLKEGLRESGLDVEHRIGLNGGHVFAGEVGPSFRRQYTVMGDAVNLAARLMSAAKPGEALISRKLLDYVTPDLCARELPPIKVKGKERPVAVCALEGDRRTTPQGGALREVRGGAPGRSEGRLFGRRLELDMVAQSLGQVRRGVGHTFLIEGDAGVGKTRLLDEALSGVSADERVTRAACFEHLRAAPFTPWIEVLDAILGTSRGESTKRRTEKARAYLKAHAPDLVELGSLLNPLLNLSLPQGHVVGSLDVGARRQKLFGLIARILVEASADRCHVVSVEDLHWMDESSLAFVRYLAEHIVGTRVLLLLTTRPAVEPVDLGEGEATRTVLEELAESEALAMVREALGVADLPAEIGEAIFAKTKGNPLFLEEVVHSLRARGVLERILSQSSVARAAEMAALDIPDRVQGLLMSRIDRLPPDTREVLKAGSVVGRSFDEALLTGIHDDLLRQVALDRAFDELTGAALVVRDDQRGRSTVTFRHALVQDVAYESLPFARRRELHGRVARYLESVQTSPDHGVLVHHYRQAGVGDKTRIHAVRASESSIAVYANREAVDYLALALDTAQGRTPPDACLRSRLEELTGDCLETLARHDEAVGRYVRARRLWRSPLVRQVSSDALREVAPIDDVDARDGALCWKIAVSVERGRSAYGRALHWLDKAAAALPPDRKGLAARILIAKSIMRSRQGRFAVALIDGEEGLRLAREDGDPELQAYALAMLIHPTYGLGLLERAIEANAEAAALYEQVGDLAGQGKCHGNIASCYQLTGDLRAALEHHELALALHARLGYTSGVAVTHGNLGELLLQMGDTDEALRHLREAVSLRADQGVPPSLTGWAFVFLARALLRRGDLPGAEQALAEGRGILLGIHARAYLLDAGVADAELRLARGDLKGAEEAAYLVLSGAHAMEAHICEAQALCLLGHVYLAEKNAELAAGHLLSSVALAERSGSDYERARALAALAEARSLRGDADESGVGELREAIDLFKRMGARHDLEKARGVLERLDAAPSGESTRPATPRS
ncbi:MAG TPA: adenylate/guanylate cyclase domain-containing protein, partial [Thermoleophilia bacterium]|nr:adenylate/guanylate cyclase domain-containing protein [Thermoleophilia bacterium]